MIPTKISGDSDLSQPKTKQMLPLKKHLALLPLACFCYFFGSAQNNTCSADFTYSVAADNTVSFIAKDSSNENNYWMFGDGSPAAGTISAEIRHQYETAGQYEVKHYITKTGINCKDSVMKIITITGVNQCSTYYTFYKDSVNLSYHFYSNSSNASGIKSSAWDFNDGSISDQLNPVHKFPTPGIYTVCLVTVTNAGCISTYCSSIQVTDSVGTCAFVPGFNSYNTPNSCKGISFHNTTSTINNSIHFTWNFGDGTTSHDINPQHNYVQTGKYYVCLVAEADSNCRKVYCDSVTVICEPCSWPLTYSFSKDSLNCKKINFINQEAADSANTHYLWNFGDGTSSRLANPSHIYNQPGNYMVCLVAETDSNCRRQYCDTIYAGCNDTCYVQPSFNWPANDSSSGIIHFKNNTVASSAAVHYSWSFGDSASSADENPVHHYAQAGVYTICLTASINNSCTKQVCQQIEIKNCNLSARFEKTQDTLKWNTVHFNNLSQPVSNIWQTYWTYGDGAASGDYNSFHQYDNPGVYNVCLKVISLNGCISQYCDTVRIVKRDSCTINANFSHNSSTSISPGLNVEALYKSSTAKYNWNFGDSTTGEGPTLLHTYSKAGNYNICLTIKDGACSTTYCQAISVQPLLSGGRITVFPNPAVSTISLDVKLGMPGQISIRILNGNGTVISSFSKSGTTGNNHYTFPVDKLSDGLYLVEIISSSGMSASRFIKG